MNESRKKNHPNGSQRISIFIDMNHLIWKVISSKMEIYPTIPPKLLSVCTETQLNSLSLITPREGQNTQIKHGHFVFLEASGLNGSQNKNR